VAERDIAGRRYALAVIEIARANGTFDRWAEALEALDALTSVPGAAAALQGDGMTDERFAGIVGQVQPGISEVELNLFRLLRRKSRLALGPSIADYFRELLDEERGIARAHVRTAVALDDAQREAIQQRLASQTGKTIVLDAEVDPSIIGGAIVQIGDQLIDGSTRRRLQRLRQDLAQAGS
jgi:F-type H+-transporting ATPase subunit delta